MSHIVTHRPQWTRLIDVRCFSGFQDADCGGVVPPRGPIEDGGMMAHRIRGSRIFERPLTGGWAPVIATTY